MVDRVIIVFKGMQNVWRGRQKVCLRRNHVWSWINVKYFGEGDWFEDRIKLEIFLPSDGDELEGAGSGAS